MLGKTNMVSEINYLRLSFLLPILLPCVVFLIAVFLKTAGIDLELLAMLSAGVLSGLLFCGIPYLVCSGYLIFKSKKQGSRGFKESIKFFPMHLCFLLCIVNLPLIIFGVPFIAIIFVPFIIICGYFFIGISFSFLWLFKRVGFVEER